MVFFAGASCSKNSSPSTSAPTPTSSVSIKNSAFDPQSLSVSSGTVVSWENFDNTAHQIVNDSNLAGFESGVLDQGATFSFTFNQAGIFRYHCSLHPEMTGEVIVK
ncbi:hypothetical protein A2V71_03390 [Candidatus Berkelbacteria bacterium RBG_13_40_8]|uniref:EfeO-type cupredoxin-like domain-containing protein n=1 Tax=Candidatus Berkelbacteria bacterium RBG_13_40_8 TaxID=1797467 RepID=A0A1F5DQW4_9BACT|nr:MAG: hypothetical protein A2V71_03390 [Candidatus Berkelbacteria bacterium RBG_13_40_8]